MRGEERGESDGRRRESDGRRRGSNEKREVEAMGEVRKE
jgi:hypothetical protein